MHKWLLLLSLATTSFVKAQNIDVVHYQYQIGLTDKSDTIYGKAFIIFVFRTNPNSVSFDLTNVGLNGKGMNVDSVYLNEPQKPAGSHDFSYNKYHDFAHSNSRIEIPVSRYKQGDTAWAVINYKGIPDGGLIIFKNKYGDRTFFADNWPNRAHHWIPCNDQPDDKASFRFIVTAPSHYSVVSNGIKVSEKDLGSGINITRWMEDIPSSTKVMVIGVAKFATKTYDDSPKDIPVSAWSYPQDSAKWFYDYDLAPGILKFLADYIGPFPYKKLANIQSKTEFGGMENASAIFYNEDYVTGRRKHEDVIAHEIAHQWFGDMVSEKSFAHLWLSEGFADYFTNFYFEKKYGKEVARKKWVEAREEVIDFARQSSKAVVDSTEDLMSLLNANSYKKGAWVLRMLHNEVGDSVFHNIIRTYYSQYKGGNAETRDFEAVAEKISGEELTWFFDQWLYRPGIPVLKMETKIQTNEFFLYVHQQGKPFRFNLEVMIIAEGGEMTTELFEVKEKESMFKVPIKGSSVRFLLDPDTKLLYELSK